MCDNDLNFFDKVSFRNPIRIYQGRDGLRSLIDTEENNYDNSSLCPPTLNLPASIQSTDVLQTASQSSLEQLSNIAVNKCRIEVDVDVKNIRNYSDRDGNPGK